MELIFSDSARREFENLEQELKSLFVKHFEKMQDTPPRKHLTHDISCHIEKVTRQTRIVFNIKGDRMYILHFFASHKDYERWYRSYK